jgi:hypothetical protein
MKNKSNICRYLVGFLIFAVGLFSQVNAQVPRSESKQTPPTNTFQCLNLSCNQQGNSNAISAYEAGKGDSTVAKVENVAVGQQKLESPTKPNLPRTNEKNLTEFPSLAVGATPTIDVSVKEKK